jgi:hypothetical protein
MSSPVEGVPEGFGPGLRNTGGKRRFFFISVRVSARSQMTEEPPKNTKPQLTLAIAQGNSVTAWLAPNLRPGDRLSRGQRDKSSFPTERKNHCLSSLTSFPSVQKSTPHRSHLDDPLLPVRQLMAEVTVLPFRRLGAEKSLDINGFSCNCSGISVDRTR